MCGILQKEITLLGMSIFFLQQIKDKQKGNQNKHNYI